MKVKKPLNHIFLFRVLDMLNLQAFLKGPLPKDFIGRVIHSDMEPIGKFSCSDEMVNQLQHNIVWG